MKQSIFKQKTIQGIHDLFYVWKREFFMIFRDQGLYIFFILVPLGYPIIYSFIYTNETIRRVPAIVVDHSHTSRSRKYIRMIDATPEVNVVSHCNDMEEAKLKLKERKAYGIIYIPEDFNDNIEKGKQSQISLFCDMSCLLYYKSLMNANSNVSLTMNADIKIEHSSNTTKRQDELTSYPIEYKDVNMFNPQNGFAAFLMPAVLMLIIQQTLLLGIGLAAGTAREENRFGCLVPINKHYSGTLRIVMGKGLGYFMIYMLVSVYILGIVPHLFNFLQLANMRTLVTFIIPYLAACIFFAMTTSALFIYNRENSMPVFIVTSVPLLFLSGISWPGCAIPDFWKYVSYLFPSTFGINGYVRINSMRASIIDVAFEYHALWLQTGFYFITTCLIYRQQIIQRKKQIYAKLKEYQNK